MEQTTAIVYSIIVLALVVWGILLYTRKRNFGTTVTIISGLILLASGVLLALNTATTAQLILSAIALPLWIIVGWEFVRRSGVNWGRKNINRTYFWIVALIALGLAIASGVVASLGLVVKALPAFITAVMLLLVGSVIFPRLRWIWLLLSALVIAASGVTGLLGIASHVFVDLIAEVVGLGTLLFTENRLRRADNIMGNLRERVKF